MEWAQPGSMSKPRPGSVDVLSTAGMGLSHFCPVRARARSDQLRSGPEWSGLAQSKPGLVWQDPGLRYLRLLSLSPSHSAVFLHDCPRQRQCPKSPSPPSPSPFHLPLRPLWALSSKQAMAWRIHRGLRRALVPPGLNSSSPLLRPPAVASPSFSSLQSRSQENASPESGNGGSTSSKTASFRSSLNPTEVAKFAAIAETWLVSYPFLYCVLFMRFICLVPNCCGMVSIKISAIKHHSQ